MTHESLKRLSRSLDSPCACCIIAVTAYLAFMMFRFIIQGHDPSLFIVAGDLYCDPYSVPDNITVLHNSAGYDGQFYYRFALDPFTSKQTDFGITLDIPWYRHQRILYPLIVWTVSFGRPALIPTMMIAVNLAAIGIMAWLAACLVRLWGRSCLWGLLIPFFPGFLLAFARNLAELLEITMLLWGVYLLCKGKPIVTALLFSAAALIKQTALIIAISAAFVLLNDMISHKKGSSSKWYIPVVPCLVFLAWRYTLKLIWGDFPTAGTVIRPVIPFYGIISFLGAAFRHETTFSRLWIPEMLFITFFSVAVFRSLTYSRSTGTFIKITWLLYFFFVITLQQSFWVEDWGFLRTLAEFYLIGILLLIDTQPKSLKYIAACSLCLWMALFLLRA